MSTEQSRVQYIANGINTEYQTPFNIFSEEAIEIYFNDTKISKEEYEYEVILDQETKATIIFEAPPPTDITITISRVLPVIRMSQFQEGGALRANTLNYEFDYQMACLQDVKDIANRSMTYPPYATSNNVDLTLPSPEAGKSIMWNEDGTKLENSNVLINELEGTINEYKTIAQNSAEVAQSAAQSAQTSSQEASLTSEEIKEELKNINNKVDTDKVQKLIEVYKNGTSWYKIFEETQENGTKLYWCEQGGRIACGGNRWTIVNLLIPFSDSNYHSSAITYDFFDPNEYAFGSVGRNNIDNFSIGNSAEITLSFNWKTEGYCNKPEEIL